MYHYLGRGDRKVCRCAHQELRCGLKSNRLELKVVHLWSYG